MRCVIIFKNAEMEQFYKYEGKLATYPIIELIENIQINNSIAKIAIAIWSKNRTELLFWWRIPAEFKGVDHSAGKNF